MKWAILLVFVFFAAACGAPATPDTTAQETAIAAKVLAQLTASAPTATSTPAATPTPDLPIPALRQFNHSLEISKDYDELKDRTYVTLRLSPVLTGENSPNEFGAYWSYKGTKATLPDVFVIEFDAIGPSYRYADTRTATFLLDNKQRIDLGANRDGHSNAGQVTVFETVRLMPTIIEFLQIVNAQHVDIHLGPSDFSFTDAQLEALRDLASRMNP